VGGMDERVARRVEEAGYRAAWAAAARPTVHIENPILCFRRVKITPSDSRLCRFAIKAYGFKGMLG
jgi:hypothetical protein